MLQSQSKALLALVDSMLVDNRLRASGRETRTSVEVPSLVRAAAFQLEVLAAQKALKLEVHVSSRTEGLVLTTDGTAVSQIVRNLLANAIKFTTIGSIQLTADVKDDWIEISVVDTGSGMIPSRAADLFRPYTGTSAAESGCGLGLSISAVLARSLGGTLEAQSTQGVGTRVTLRLPVGGVPSTL
jgi:signal transduction histidine kinase